MRLRLDLAHALLLGQEAKVIAANNNSNCSAVTISSHFYFFLHSVFFFFLVGLFLVASWATWGTMYQQWSAARCFYCRIAARWHFKCNSSSDSGQQQLLEVATATYRKHYLVNVDDMTRPLNATNKQTMAAELSTSRGRGERERERECVYV